MLVIVVNVVISMLCKRRRVQLQECIEITLYTIKNYLIITNVT